jgi:hypothetical protein
VDLPMAQSQSPKKRTKLIPTKEKSTSESSLYRPFNQKRTIQWDSISPQIAQFSPSLTPHANVLTHTQTLEKNYKQSIIQQIIPTNPKPIHSLN